MSERRSASRSSHPAPAPPPVALDKPTDREKARGLLVRCSADFGTEAGGEARAPIVFVHGLGSDGAAWQPQIEAVDPDFHWLTWDLRGHGKSDRLTETHTIRQHADDLETVLAAFPDLGPVHLVGLSLGSMVALEFAARHPSRVASLFLVSPLGDTRLTTWVGRWIYLSRMAALRLFGLRFAARLVARKLFPEGSQREQRRAALDALAANDPRSYRCALAGIRDWKVLDRAERIEAPVTLVHPVHDFLPRASAEKLAEALPNAELVDVEGAGHVAPIEAPDKIDPLLLEHLSQYAAT